MEVEHHEGVAELGRDRSRNQDIAFLTRSAAYSSATFTGPRRPASQRWNASRYVYTTGVT